ncbi:dihydrofolate reductase family protein [Streptomyces sp. B-S-A8]|uniref:Dihydrofolate reductase family protein n=1 Tax=Streptomyces solicavernae TaxID=3043614 RepID=A0ABT6RL87_9ACTN|nr:dihydrofolate reductase family protein [Streptomyces sp. B-S-A8]MDI3385189.1 dihydrofolate reductase family protein [Streptomyces sp. B-S-A8]
MRLTLTQMVTLDGVMQGPGSPDEDTSGGFTQGGWVWPYFDEDFSAFVDENFRRADAFLLGRRTYEIFAAYWPKQSGDPVSDALNSLPKYVASTTLAGADWEGAQVIGGDLAAEVTALKEQPGRELQMHGSAGLARSLFADGLIDTVHLIVLPVVLGAGKRLFAEGTLPTAFRNADTRVTRTGVVIGTYEREGAPEYASL